MMVFGNTSASDSKRHEIRVTVAGDDRHLLPRDCLAPKTTYLLGEGSCVNPR